VSQGPYAKVFKDNVFTNNPILVQVLGICSTLAVTNMLSNTLIMTVGVALVTAFSSWSLSLINAWIPRKVRMIVQVLVISFWTIIVDILLRAYAPEVSASLGPYVGLIITNCIIMGRAEAFAQANKPVISWWDGLTSGLGYMMILVMFGIVRELLGFGTLLGFQIFPLDFAGKGNNWTIMVMAPSAFFLVAITLWVSKTYQLKKSGGKK
jgi:Na+-transporting NADH:ubiquinone oxidoreductase subunit D